jgi:alpha-glucuronidase
MSSAAGHTIRRNRSRLLSSLAVSLFVAAIGSSPVLAEDGYELWLRYRPVADKALLAHYRARLTALRVEGSSDTIRAATDELARGLSGLLAASIATSSGPLHDGSVVAGTPKGSPLVAGLNLGADLANAGDEGFVLRSQSVDGHAAIVIAASRDVGVLYGAFELLKLVSTGQRLDGLSLVSAPRLRYRVLDHWDNLNRTVERGYAGFSLWDWQKLPDYLDPRYRDYARANASIGVNGAVVNSVNANATSLTREWLVKAAALASVFRPYGIRLYLSARFSAPIELGKLKTADPLDPQVAEWWKCKADEIYSLIPDFGGFLVKANSEGQPGPQDYKRSHAEGANVLADALAPHGGIVMWRAFVYSSEVPDDRAKQAYNEFKPQDGAFRPNVMVQVKNGPIDFQPREPFHPLFGAMPKTPLMMEFQITQEYLGFATHLVYLAPLFEETLGSDTFAKGAGSTVARVIQGEVDPYAITGMAGVANVGTDRNWCGSAFACANWYAFGRLAWNPGTSSAEIADEWIRRTFTSDPAFVEPVKKLMLGSREAAVDYMTPLGLVHQMARNHHYGPGPWVSGGPRADWTSPYYHRADGGGIGFDRGPSGSGAVSQYSQPVAARFSSLDSVPENLLLYFHHVPWDHRMRSGRTLWDELLVRYQAGVDAVRGMQAAWAGLARFVDPERFEQVRVFLAIQEQEARWWRDACVLYFQTFSGRPLPAGYEKPAHDLEFYESIDKRYVPGIS